MKDTMTEFSFCDWFRKSENRKNQFSYEGLKALYEHLIQYEEDCDTELEFDPIAFCCEYSEYENLNCLFRNMKLLHMLKFDVVEHVVIVL